VITAQTTPATLTGGAGDDTLVASQGADRLTGGGGNDVFRWGHEPWAPAHVTDFAVGLDRLDLTALLQQAGYSGNDPVRDHYVILQSDGTGGTQVLFDPDGPATAHQWPDYIIDLEHAQVTSWAQLVGSEQPASPPPQPTSPPPPPSTAGQTLTAQPGGSNLQGGAGDDTLFAGHGADTLTGAGGADHFVFGDVPWQAGHVTDFTHGVDRIDVSGLLSKAGYAGADPIADGYIKLIADGQGDTWVYFDSDGRGTADQWGTLVVTLDHVTPGSVTAGDWIFR
jgi:Ca2+-binding RTX toxin-like protein